MNDLFTIATAHAACATGAICPVGNETDTVPTGTFTDSLRTIASSVMTVLLLIAGVLAVFYLIYSGIRYITSAGSADQAKAARAGIVNAVIGIIVIVAAYFIIRVSVGIGRDIACSDRNSVAQCR